MPRNPRLPPFVVPGLPDRASFPRTSRPVVGAPPSEALPPVPAFEPNVIAVAPPLPAIVADGVGDDYESALRTFEIREIPVSGLDGPLSVYATQKRWRAVDVYIATTAAGAGGTPYLEIGIFAIAKGVRSLVATGRMRGDAAGVFRRIAAARVVADRFEVVIQKTAAMATPLAPVQIAIVASDEANEPDTDQLEGSIPAAPLGALTALAVIGISAAPQIAVMPVAIHAVNEAAADRYIQFATALAGATRASWLVPSLGTLIFTDEEFLQQFRTFGDLVFRQSSTPFVDTPSGDVRFMFWFR